LDQHGRGQLVYLPGACTQGVEDAPRKCEAKVADGTGLAQHPARLLDLGIAGLSCAFKPIEHEFDGALCAAVPISAVPGYLRNFGRWLGATF
jgi:hypothetical protein